MTAMGVRMTQIALIEPEIRMSASLSQCGTYRWKLERWWGEGKRHVVFVMCNPSTANGMSNDPTLLVCIHFAKLWGYDGLIVVNLFPFRSPHPAVCRAWYEHWDKRSAWDVRDAIQSNTILVAETAKAADLVVAAWGCIPWSDGIEEHILEEIMDGCEPWPSIHCLGLTKDGHPKHPLARGHHRIPRDQQPILWKANNNK